jgi:hypothetical protein
MMRRILILSVLVLLARSAGAFLPPDASAREPQIRAYRQRVRRQYEQRQIERQAQAIRAYEKTQADVFTPPWMRGGTQAAVSLETATVSPETKKAGGRKNRFLVSFVLLILLGAGAGWVRYATREVDK